MNVCYAGIHGPKLEGEIYELETHTALYFLASGLAHEVDRRGERTNKVFEIGEMKTKRTYLDRNKRQVETAAVNTKMETR